MGVAEILACRALDRRAPLEVCARFMSSTLASLFGSRLRPTGTCTSLIRIFPTRTPWALRLLVCGMMSYWLGLPASYLPDSEAPGGRYRRIKYLTRAILLPVKTGP